MVASMGDVYCCGRGKEPEPLPPTGGAIILCPYPELNPPPPPLKPRLTPELVHGLRGGGLRKRIVQVRRNESSKY
eukprot:5875348-Pyramimonas_sp.AAC.1